MANKDLRAWIEEIEAAGELRTVTGAEREEEIGAIVDIHMRKMANPAVLFDQVPGYPKGHRVLANILTSVPRINIALGLAVDTPEIELVRYWRDYMKDAPSIPPTTVNGGPLLENVSTGDDVDILKIPTPRWHEHDGGYYIGTACMVIMKDPDSGWINYGAYRIQAHDRNVASVMTSKGKHGNLILNKYHQRGEPCPIAVVVGMHPAVVMVAGLEIPYGKNEYDCAGGLLGESIEVIEGPATGLPLPANAEIAFEGFVHPGDLIDEGPLGEWTGYYAGGAGRKSDDPGVGGDMKCRRRRHGLAQRPGPEVAAQSRAQRPAFGRRHRRRRRRGEQQGQGQQGDAQPGQPQTPFRRHLVSPGGERQSREHAGEAEGLQKEIGADGAGAAHQVGDGPVHRPVEGWIVRRISDERRQQHGAHHHQDEARGFGHPAMDEGADALGQEVGLVGLGR